MVKIRYALVDFFSSGATLIVRAAPPGATISQVRQLEKEAHDERQGQLPRYTSEGLLGAGWDAQEAGGQPHLQRHADLMTKAIIKNLERAALEAEESEKERDEP